MTHAREQIMSGIQTIVTGLTTTTTNVFRGRAYPIAENNLPGLLLQQGDEEPTSDISEIANDYFVDSILSVDIQIVVQSASNVDTIINQIDAEIIQALAVDYQLGMSSYVINSWQGRITKPDYSNEGSQAIAFSTRSWQVMYRIARTNPN